MRGEHLWGLNVRAEYMRTVAEKRDDASGLGEGWRVDPCVVNWLGKRSSNPTRLTMLRAFFRYVADGDSPFKDMTPSELVDFQILHQMNPDKRVMFAITDVAQGWAKHLRKKNGEEYAVNSKANYYATVRSFFKSNRGPLPPDGDFYDGLTSDYVPPESTLSPDEFRKIVIVSGDKPMYQAIWVSLMASGMDCKRFLEWNESRGALDALLDTIDDPYKPLLKLRFRKGRKRNKKEYYSFLGGDALTYLKEWLPDRIEPRTGNAIFVNDWKTPVKYARMKQVWDRKCILAGLRPKSGESRYGKNLHETRDLFKTRWQKSLTPIIGADFMMGHTIDKLKYNKAMNDEVWGMELYLQAQKWLNIMSETPDVMSRREAVILQAVAKDSETKLTRSESQVTMLQNALDAQQKELERKDKLIMLLKDPDRLNAFLDTMG